MGQGLIYDVALELLEGTAEKIEEKGGGELGRVGVVHGDLVWDSICGYLAIRMTRLFLTSSFPTPGQNDRGGTDPCWSMIPAADYELTVLRCVPNVEARPGAKPTFPSEAEMTASAIELSRDALALLLGVMSVAKGWGKYRRVSIGEVVPVGPDGGGSGSSLVVTVELPDCWTDPDVP